MMNEVEIIRHRQMDELNIFFVTLDYRTPHIHKEWELMYVLNNTLSVICNSERYLVSPGEMILFGPNEPHEFHKESGSCTCLCMQLFPEALPTIIPVVIDGKMPHRYLTQREYSLLKMRVEETAKAYFYCENYASLYCLGNACLLLHQLLNCLPTHILSEEEMQGMGKRSARLNRLIQFVDENYMHKIRLSDFAEQEGCSMSYLSRFIKLTLNQSFQEYVKSVRFNCACNLISNENMRLLDVCLESGFSDYRYFSQEFHRQYNMTPEEYRRTSRQSLKEPENVYRNLYSSERHYSKEESLRLIDRYFSK